MIVALAAMAMWTGAHAQTPVKLPSPKQEGGMPLMEALQKRHSERTFSEKPISDATLSQILWAACGINRKDSKRITAPSAMNKQDIVVYVCRKDGAWKYNPEGQSLEPASKEDLRKYVAGRQEAVANAPVMLVLCSDHTKFGETGNSQQHEILGAVDCGYVSQNIALACTSLGINTVPRMTMDQDALRKALALPATTQLLINHPIGYPQ